MNQDGQLLQVAAEHAGDIHALCSDVASMIFPSAIFPPSEAVINAVSAKLRQIVSDLETALMSGRRERHPSSWPTLAKSGFLKEPELIDFILARVAEYRVQDAIGSDRTSMPALLLDNADVDVADAAQILLAAESLHRHSSGNAHLALTPELLHKLCWRVTAALEVVQGTRQPEIIAAARHIIATYSEAHRAQSAARKIVHLSADADFASFLDPGQAGIYLHTAALSSKLDLDQDHVVRLIDAGSCAPYAIMLAAVALPKPQAIEAIYLVRRGSLTAREAGLFDSGYETLGKSGALAEVAKWASARTAFLAFGQP